MVIEDLLDGSAIAMDLARNKIVVNVPAYDLAGEYVRTKLAYFWMCIFRRLLVVPVLNSLRLWRLGSGLWKVMAV